MGLVRRHTIAREKGRSIPTAAVLLEFGKPLELLELRLSPPKADEISVRLTASGVCHTDYTVATGGMRGYADIPLPIVLGHEGAGIVTAIGSDVHDLVPGDHVILSAIPQCGACFYCRRQQHSLCNSWRNLRRGRLLDGTTRFSRNEAPIYQYNASGTFSQQTVVPRISAVKIDSAMPLEVAALIGCAVVTGNSAARRVANIEPGDTVVIIGSGAVGLSIVEGSRLAGADQIIAVDSNPWKLELAQVFGATHLVRVPDEDPASVARELTDDRGADVVFEAAGPVETITAAIECARPGGEVVVLASDVGKPVELAFAEKMLGPARTLRGCIYGNADVRRDFPKLVRMYLDGQLHLHELITQRIPLEDINRAFDDMKRGTVARSLVVF